jgi:hypothetical protein
VGYLADSQSDAAIPGPLVRMEAVIDIGVADPTTGQGAPRFIYVRDLSELDNPRAYEPPSVANQ